MDRELSSGGHDREGNRILLNREAEGHVLSSWIREEDQEHLA